MKNKAWFALVMLVAIPGTALAQSSEQAVDQHHSRRTLTAMRVPIPPVIDGILNEPAWEQAEVAQGFVQKDPQEGMPATERTEVRVLHDGANLYFGVVCIDSEPDRILARELRRDNQLGNDDTFAIILDTFHDHRNAFLFRINPRGTQYDALITEEGRVVNATWDERWEVNTEIHDHGWSAEIKIPLKSIRFSDSEESPSFGIDFDRVIRRKNEASYWSNYLRNYNFHQVSQAGHLLGLEDLRAGLRFRIKPYVTSEVVTRGPAGRKTNLLGDVGLEVLKVPISSGVTLDFTANPDFAQTEVDQEVINFDRVPLFFAEKREFFLEGAGIFEFGTLRGEGSADVKLYHSRQIGLSPERKQIPILAGAKLTGRLGDRYTLAALNVQTDDDGDQPGDNFGVFRIKRDLFERSSLGVFFTNRQGGGDSNRVVGIDQNLVFFRYFSVNGLLARSFTEGMTGGDQLLGGIGAGWSDDLISVGFDYSVVERDFRSDIGFLERVGVRKYAPNFRYSPRPAVRWIRQTSHGVRLDHIRRLEDNQLETEVYHLNNSITFSNGSAIRFNPHRRVENLDRPLRLAGGRVVVPAGHYQWWYYPVIYAFDPARKLTGSFQYRYEKDYFGKEGRRQMWNFSPQVQVNDYISASINYSLNRIQLPGGSPVDIHVSNSRLNVSFSRKWLTSTLFQYSNTSELIGANFRLRYNYRAGDDLYIVFNDFRSGRGLLKEVNRSVVVKFTRSFDF